MEQQKRKKQWEWTNNKEVERNKWRKKVKSRSKKLESTCSQGKSYGSFISAW
jgi:hypothetical protein